MSLFRKILQRIGLGSDEDSKNGSSSETLYAIPIGTQKEIPALTEKALQDKADKITESSAKEAIEIVRDKNKQKFSVSSAEDDEKPKKSSSLENSKAKIKSIDEGSTTKSKIKAVDEGSTTKSKIKTVDEGPITKSKIKAVDEYALIQEASSKQIPVIKMDSSDREPDGKLNTTGRMKAVGSDDWEGEERRKADRTKPKYSLQLKMMAVISLILAVTVSIIISLATYYYKEDNQKRIEEVNLDNVQIVNSKVKTDILSVISQGEQLSVALRKDINKEIGQKLVEQFLKKDEDFIFLGIFGKENGQLVKEKLIFNEEHLKKVSLTEEEILTAVKRKESSFMNSFAGMNVIENTSPGFQEPTLSISIPDAEGRPYILVMMFKLDKILEAFKKKSDGYTVTFMVGADGTILAHSDPAMALSAKNVRDIPIVNEMLTDSKKNNGLTQYDYEGKKYLGAFKKLDFINVGVVTAAELDKAFQEVYRLRNRNILIMLISLCVSMILVFLFAKSISHPIVDLFSETVKISQGNFQIDIRRTTNDEVGVLTDYFITMAKGLEEREKVKSILGSMIDPIVVQEAMKDLVALRRGSEKTVTAFFSDVAGFSSISEQLSSADLAALLNEYLSAMTVILKKHGGVLDKYIGDAIVGIFGAPVDLDRHFLKAAKASVEMIQKLEDLRQYWVRNSLYTKEAQEMDVRIGLNTGLAKVGFMGTNDMGSYTMMGDTVNLAARLEAAGKDYGVNILISEMVNEKIHDEMFTRELDLVRVKGKNEPVRLYELIGRKTEIRQNILEAARIYEEGFKAYLKRDWEKSIKFLNECSKVKGKKDKAALALIERCESYLKNPPAKDWDGVFTRTHK